MFFRIHSLPLRKVPPIDDASERSLADFAVAGNTNEDKFEELSLNELLRAQGHQNTRSGDHPRRAALSLKLNVRLTSTGKREGMMSICPPC